MDALDPAAETWSQTRATADLRQIERYIATYPNSPYRTATEFRLNELRLQPFTVTLEPASARVRLADRTESYRPGMMLPAGRYRVEVSADGYETRTVMVRHGGSPTTQHVALLRAGPKVGDSFRDCPECPEMVVVPAGSYRMGSPSHEAGHHNEGPVHRVTIAAPFAVGKYAVTFAEWDACEEAGGCGGYIPEDFGWGRDQRPVINVNWDDAQRYVQWLSKKTKKRYRLLSESEWEYAARAGTQTAYSWGDDRDFDTDGQWGGGRAHCLGYRSQWDGQTAPVGSFPANRWGLHDMHGNVDEWVQDCWNESYAGAPRNGTSWLSGDCSQRVLRGGSWSFRPSFLRAAYRLGGTAGGRVNIVGFRVARTLAP